MFPLVSTRAGDSGKASQKATENRLANSLEGVRKYLEEWGSVTISEPLLLPVGADFDLGAEANFATAAQYIEANRTGLNAAVGQFSQSALVARAGLGLQLPAAQAMGPATGTTTAPAAATSTTSTPTPPTPELPTEMAKDLLVKPTFEAPNSLVPTLNGITERQAVHSGLGDKIDERAMRLFANPSALKDGAKRYYAVFQVTCNPGWRTTQHYMADIQLQFEYGRYSTNKNGTQSLTPSLSDDAMVQPVIIAALPLQDAQNIELRNGQRQIADLALALAAAGPTSIGTVSGKGLINYINSFQSDASSRHAMPVVNSYSTGTSMGFRFSPSFMALGDPTKKRSPSENRLIPTSFPVVLLVEFRPNDYKPASGDKYTHLITHYSQRWTLRDHEFSILPWKWPKKRETERARLDLTRAFEEASNQLGDAFKANPSNDPFSTSDTFRALRRDYFEIQQKAVLRSTINDLPADLLKEAPKVNPPSIQSIIPEIINPAIDNAIVIKGKNVGDSIKAVTIGGRNCTILQSTSGAVLAQLAAGPVALTEEDKTSVVIFTDKGVDTKPIAVASKQDTVRGFTLKRDEKGQIISLEFREEGSLKGDKLIDAAAAILGSGGEKKSSGGGNGGN